MAYGVAVLLSISSHTCILAACISFVYGLQVLGLTYNYIKSKKSKLLVKENIKTSKVVKNWIVIVLLFSLFLVTAYYVRTPSDHVEFKNSEYRKWEWALTVISDCLVTNGNNLLTCSIVTAFTVIVSFFVYFRDKRYFEFLLYVLPVYLFLSFFYCNKWHIGIVFEIILFALIIHGKLDKNNNDKTIKFLFLIVCFIQIFYSYKTCRYDYYYQYSAAKNIVEFINNNNGYKDMKIYGIGYSATAIEPYFPKNIFSNKLNNKGFYSWRENEPDYMTLEEMKDDLPDILIVSTLSSQAYFTLMNRVEVTKLYEKYYFEGETYVKNSVYENEGFYVYVSNKVLSYNKDYQNTEVVILPE